MTEKGWKRNNSNGGNSNGNNKSQKLHKELLTEEEKRANHIMSEQKRRSTIRTGFKDLTDIVPTLKNINNSKSTVLFKAVDYIRYLEKRNKNLREKIGGLEMRVDVEGRMGGGGNGGGGAVNGSGNTGMMTGRSHHRDSRYSQPYPTPRQQQQQQQAQQQDRSYRQETAEHPYANPSPPRSSPSAANAAAAALMAHKNQQKQLMALQEQLHLHQKLLAHQQDIGPRSKTTSRPLSSHYTHAHANHHHNYHPALGSGGGGGRQDDLGGVFRSVASDRWYPTDPSFLSSLPSATQITRPDATRDDEEPLQTAVSA
ncbi:hypothetical protein F4703DRAFT_1846356 [Phycomyces blakesleeanus]